MWNTSRGLRETVVRALAKVGLVWALAVLGALFMATAAQGHETDGTYTLGAAGAGAGAAKPTTSFSVESAETPRPAGLALALVVLAGGVTILVVGAARQRSLEHTVVREPDLAGDLPLALGLGLLGSGLA